MTYSKNKWSREIEALTEASGHLEFIERLSGQLALSSEEKKKIEMDINEIRKKIDARELRLAVVGEFSSGKSTFINAILRRVLLKASLIPTTATATRLRYAKELEVETVIDGWRFFGKESDYADLYVAVRKLKPGLAGGASLKDVLAVLTADSELGKRVKDVVVGYPSETLRNDLLLLDTPGIGTGTDITTYHGDVTINVIKNEADAAVVLLPSNISMTGTILNFLEAHARHLVSRCIFILTKMDSVEVEGSEREKILRYVRKTLKERFCLDNPILHESAALAMLLPGSKNNHYWKKEFEKLEKHLFSEVIRLRSVFVAENLLRLISDLMNQLEKSLNDMERAIGHEESVIRSQIIVLDSGQADPSEALLADTKRFCETDIPKIIRDNTRVLGSSIAGKLTPFILGAVKKEVFSWRRGWHQTLSDMETGIQRNLNSIMQGNDAKQLISGCVTSWLKDTIAFKVANEAEKIFRKMPRLSFDTDHSVQIGGVDSRDVTSVIVREVDNVIGDVLVNVVVGAVILILAPLVTLIVAGIGIPIVSTLAAIIFSILALIPGPGWIAIAAIASIATATLLFRGVDGAKDAFLEKKSPIA